MTFPCEVGIKCYALVSLFQALGQWGRSKSSVGLGDEWDLVGKEEVLPLSLGRPCLSPQPALLSDLSH